MNKERELLALILSYAGNKYLTVDEFEMMAQIEETFKEISELLTQPEQEPLTPRQGLEEYKRGYARAELDLKREPLSDEAVLNLVVQYSSRNELARAIEKAHGIGGGE